MTKPHVSRYISTAEKAIREGTASLTADLNQFFQTVELYQSGVFSHTTKESIATLGIGSKLDALETEFTELDREQFAQAASAELFPDANRLIQGTKAQLLELLHETGAAMDEARTIRTEKPESNQTAVIEALDSSRAKLAEDIRAGLQSEVDSFCSHLSVSVGNSIVEMKTASDSTLSTLRIARRKRYTVAALCTAVVYATASYAYHHTGAPSPSTLLGEAGLNLLCGSLVEVVVLGCLKLKENVPKLLADTRANMHLKLQDDLHSLIDARLASLPLASLNGGILQPQLRKIYELPLDLPGSAWKERADETLLSIHKSSSQYADLRMRFQALTEQVRADASRYFTDSSRNLLVLNQVAAKIKAKAIEPSFALLEETRNELQGVRSDVDEVSFV